MTDIKVVKLTAVIQTSPYLPVKTGGAIPITLFAGHQKPRPPAGAAFRRHSTYNGATAAAQAIHKQMTGGGGRERIQSHSRESFQRVNPGVGGSRPQGYLQGLTHSRLESVIKNHSEGSVEGSFRGLFGVSFGGSFGLSFGVQFAVDSSRTAAHVISDRTGTCRAVSRTVSHRSRHLHHRHRHRRH